jgi:hypothetical protein
MKYEIKTLEEITLIVPVDGGDAIAQVYKREHAQTLLDALNFVPAHPIECEGKKCA